MHEVAMLKIVLENKIKCPHKIEMSHANHIHFFGRDIKNKKSGWSLKGM